MEKPNIIGLSVPRVDGEAKATGLAEYTGDLTPPDTLYGKILRSPYPHAFIKHIDISRALRLPGVKAIVIGKDTSGQPIGPRGGPKVLFSDRYPLALERVRFVGDEVAALAATDEDVACEALELIEVVYEQLPAVFDPEEAMKPSAPDISGKGNNIAWEIHQDIGDVEKGFRESDHVRQDRFRTQPVSHFALEAHNCLAAFDSSGKVTIWSSSSVPFVIRANISRLFNIPISKVRVITPAVGGNFGGKGGVFSHHVCAVLLAQKTGRPVLIDLSREEVVNATRVRHAQIIDVKTGVKKDGAIVGQAFHIISDNGAYAGQGGLGLYLTCFFLTAPLRAPNVKCDAYQVYTNNPMGGAMRGYGSPQIRFATNCQLDMIARDLGLDTAELMMKNAVEPGQTLPNGMRITSCGLKECVKKATDDAGWREAKVKSQKARGRGIACYSFICGENDNPYMGFSAVVKVHEDGGITLFTGAVDVGQGSSTLFAQIVAEEFGLRTTDIRLVTPDTEVTPPDPGTFSSRLTFWTGNAVKAAAADAKQQLLEVIASKLEANPADLVARDRRVYVKGSPDRGISIDEAILTCQLATQGRPIIGRGYYTKPINPVNERSCEGNISDSYSFGATVAEVEVDRESGQVEVLNLTMAHDCGFAINPMAVQGQLEGSALMGKGYALSEELLRDQGATLNPSFLGYPLDTSLSSTEIRPILVESLDPEGPFGAKEAGEGLVVSVAPAIANAIYDAVGVRVKTLPITAEKVLRELEKKS